MTTLLLFNTFGYYIDEFCGSFFLSFNFFSFLSFFLFNYLDKFGATPTNILAVKRYATICVPCLYQCKISSSFFAKHLY